MHRLTPLAACLAFGILAACSGAPSGDSPDYEIDDSRPPAASSSGGTKDEPSAAGDEPAPPAKPVDTAGDGGTDAPVGPTQPAPNVAVVKVDGVELTVTSTSLWSEQTGPGKYNLFIRVEGPGVPAGSDVHVFTNATGVGCSTSKGAYYRPTGAAYRSNDDASCGLSIPALPTAVGDRMTGTFKGTVTAANVTPLTTKTMEVTFDILRVK